MGPDRGRRGDLRLRQRQHHGARVRAALMEIYRAKTNGSDPSADEWLQGLRDSDRYLEDIWGEMASGL